VEYAALYNVKPETLGRQIERGTSITCAFFHPADPTAYADATTDPPLLFLATTQV